MVETYKHGVVEDQAGLYCGGEEGGHQQGGLARLPHTTIHVLKVT